MKKLSGNLVLFALGTVNLGSIFFFDYDRWIPEIILTSLFCMGYAMWLERHKGISRQELLDILDNKDTVAANNLRLYQDDLAVAHDAIEMMARDLDKQAVDMDYLSQSLRDAKHRVDMQAIMDASVYFSEATFGKDRLFSAPLKKMREEIDEAIASGKLEEFADMQILLFDAAAKKGYNVKMLFRASYQKINVLWNRDWSLSDGDAVYHHIKGDEKKDTNGNEPPEK